MKFDTPLRRWDVLVTLARERGLQRLVEVGCKDGRTTEALAKGVEGSHVWAIDPWRAMPEHEGEGAETYQDWDFAQIEAQFRARTADVADRVTMMRCTSLEAARELSDQQFDLVFIDAAHDERNVTADIVAWWPRVRTGGLLSGHDYQHKFPGVMRAVASAFPLIRVAVLPDSVWVVWKEADLPQVLS